MKAKNKTKKRRKRKDCKTIANGIIYLASLCILLRTIIYTSVSKQLLF